MKRSTAKLLRTWSAWALLAVFVLAGLCRSLHQCCYHDADEATCCAHHHDAPGHPTDGHDHDGPSTSGSIKASCPVCDLDFFKAEAPRLFCLVAPPLQSATAITPFSAQVARLCPLDLRANSPPVV